MAAYRLALPPLANTLLLGDLYRNMIATYPKLTLNVVEALSGALTQKMLEGENRRWPASIHNSSFKGLVLEPMISDEWVFVSAETNAPPGTEIRFDDLTKYPLILPSRMSGMRMRLDSTAAENGHSLSISCIGGAIRIADENIDRNRHWPHDPSS